MDEYQRFASLGFDDFRRMAKDPSLSAYEKIGFPNAYREGKEPAIWDDIRSKLHALSGKNKIVIDIGPGCSELPAMLIALCEAQDHRLVLVDSAEMLAQLPDRDFIEKHDAIFPDCPALLDRYRGRVDTLLCYSVLHYVVAEGDLWSFLDSALGLLADGGEILLGDIPNASMRARFFASAAGIAFHRAFTGDPEALPPAPEPQPGTIDDALVLSILERARGQGFDAFVVPQSPGLPMANRREDILIRKP